jgi:4-hydroxy-tetrahydrodipicolinate reductase
MKIGLLGYGKMGREIEQVARQLNHEISVIFEIDDRFDADSDVKGARVLIDFSVSQAVIAHLRTAASLGLPVVQGTTGWDAQLPDAMNIPGLTMIYSPNFSLGVYLFTKMAEQAAGLFGSFNEYDCYVHEWHHRGKADSPSGTAKKLANVMLAHLPHKDKILGQTSEGKIDPKALHVTSTRVGRIPGTHEIGFDSQYDTVLLRHEAHGREGLAFGAVRAAEWIVDKHGILTMDEFMVDLLSSKK